jgi:5-methylcytosine-specific restriction endonuclease McrA
MPRKSQYTPDEKWFISKMRQVATEWPARERCITNARKGPDKYECRHCLQLFHRSMLQADHVSPVIDPEIGWQGKGNYIERLLCDDSGWQALCRSCHYEKTQAENKTRREASKKRLATASE